MAEHGHWQFGDGVRQGDRLPEALADGYIDVDERNFAALLAGMAEAAGRLPFVDQANQFAGTWQRLFEREDLAVMADILATRTAPLERRFLDAMHRDPTRASAAVQDLAGRIDGWLQRLGRMPERPAVELHRRVAELVSTRLGPALATLPAAAYPVVLDAAWGWRLDADRQGLAPAPADPRRELQAAYSALIGAVRLLQTMAPAYLKDSLARDDHEPAFALILAFLRLFGDTQQHLNRFTRRHNDFYYRDVLGTRERLAVPEQVLLAFPAATAREAVPIRHGDPVLATTGDGTPPLRFQADADGFASAVRIAGLHALHFERDPLLSPQREMDFVTRIYRLRLPVEPLAEKGAPSWSLFGRDAAGAEAVDAAPMGLVISTPLLLLREGQRRIDLQLVLRPLGGRSGARVGATLDEAWCETWLRADPGLVDACALGSAKDVVARLMAGSNAPQRLVQPAHVALFPDDPLYLVFVLALVRIATPENPRGFSAPFGRLMARLMLGPDRRVPPSDSERVEALLTELADAADRVLSGADSPEDKHHSHGRSVRILLTESRVSQYAKYLSDAFTLDLSTANGWLRVPEIGVAPLETEADDASRIGLRITCDLPPDAPAIEADPTAAAGGGDRPPAPGARLLLAPGATLCAYSLLAPFVLEEVEAVVAVEGLRSLKGYSELGPVDAAKPFQPFGPTPRLGTSFIVGAYEPALKRVETANLRLVWSGLPRDFGGFPAYYRQYGEEWADARFGAQVDWLAGGVWVSANGGAPVPLFCPTDAASRLPATQTLDMRAPAAAEPLPPTLAATDFRYDLAAQGGFIRLRLTGPAGAFGHQVYPLLLSRSMGRTAFWRGPREPINPPYTPVLAGLELDYTARTIIRVAQVPREYANRKAEFVDHVAPYGSEEVHPVPLQPEPGPLQRRAADSALYIALRDTGPGKPVSLLFRMAERARRRRRYDTPAVAWQYLAESAWRSLPHDLLLSDTTSALMRSGMVTLTLPDDLADIGGRAGGPRVPGTGRWLRIITNADPATFPRVAGLVVNGLTASRVVAEDVPHKPLPPGIAWQLETTPPGLGAMVEVRAATGGHPPETPRQFRARISERLRHRHRAVTAWDYERLVLEQFPQVQLVKCFPALDDARPDVPAAGKVLMVAVPQAATTGSERYGERRMLDALSLREIQEALTRQAPAGAQVEVRNAAYDMIQVRGRVRFSDAADRGRLLRALVEDVSAYLSPWDDRGQRRGFGWRLNAADVQAFIAERDYVRHVSEFGMLMLSVDDHGCYRLADTAPPRPADNASKAGAPAAAGRRSLSHSVPWSLPLPLHWQALEAVQSDERRPASAAGVGLLGVGATLVATGRES